MHLNMKLEWQCNARHAEQQWMSPISGTALNASFGYVLHVLIQSSDSIARHVTRF
jgi:hypothetical protein